MNWKPELSSLSKPLYRGLADQLESDIAAGRLRDGDRLPAQRELANSLGVTVTTITRAIREATRRGIVAARTGSGTFVQVSAARDPVAASPADLWPIDLSLNTMPMERVAAILDRVMQDIAGAKLSADLFSYQPAQGSSSHREAAAKWLAARQLPVDPSAILLTHGAQHGLITCLHLLTKAGDTVLCEAFAYSGIRRLAEHVGVRLVGVGMDDQGLRPDDLAHKFGETRASVLICSAAVQNPTTSTMTSARREDVVAVCRRHDALIIEDDINGHLSGDPEPPLAAFDRAGVFYVTSLSKCVSPGLRFGVLCPPASFLTKTQEALVAIHWTAPSFPGEIFARLVQCGGIEECYAVHRREMARRRDLAAQILGDMVPVQDGLPSSHLWIEVPASWQSAELVAALVQAGVRVSPGSHFAADPDIPDTNRIRICLGGTTEEALALGLAEIARMMRQRPPRNAPLV